ncbi:MAG: dihydroneopterin aldolase [Chloroflexi bacterium]|nr:dihydroneopterin aldolase [Chloroflexota bacterium]
MALQQPLPPDSISLEGMAFYGYHGVNPEERALGQRFIVDLHVYLDLSMPGASDILADTISYSELYRTAQSVLEGQPYNLLEAVAQALAQRVLTSFPVKGVRVRVTKPSPPLHGGATGSAAVEIYRELPREGQ